MNRATQATLQTIADNVSSKSEAIMAAIGSDLGTRVIAITPVYDTNSEEGKVIGAAILMDGADRPGADDGENIIGGIYSAAVTLVTAMNILTSGRLDGERSEQLTDIILQSNELLREVVDSFMADEETAGSRIEIKGRQ